MTKARTSRNRTIPERLTALEERMDQHEATSKETNMLVKQIAAQMTISKGAIMGAMAVLSAVVGVVGFGFKSLLGLLTGQQ